MQDRNKLLTQICSVLSIFFPKWHSSCIFWIFLSKLHTWVTAPSVSSGAAPAGTGGLAWCPALAVGNHVWLFLTRIWKAVTSISRCQCCLFLFVKVSLSKLRKIIALPITVRLLLLLQALMRSEEELQNKINLLLILYVIYTDASEGHLCGGKGAGWFCL